MVKTLAALLCSLVVVSAQTTTTTTTTTTTNALGLDSNMVGIIALIGGKINEINSGAMQALLSDPSSTVVQTDCITKTKDTGVAISKMFDVSRYTGWLDVINYLNVVSIKSQNQFQNCGVDKYLARFD